MIFTLKNNKSINIEINNPNFSIEYFSKIEDLKPQKEYLLNKLELKDLKKIDIINIFDAEDLKNYLKIKVCYPLDYENYSIKNEKINYIVSKIDSNEILNLFKIKDYYRFNDSFLYICLCSHFLTNFFMANKKIIKEYYNENIEKINDIYLNDIGCDNYDIDESIAINYIKIDKVFDFLNIKNIDRILKLVVFKYSFKEKLLDYLENKIGREVIIKKFIEEKESISFKKSKLFYCINNSLFNIFLKEFEDKKIILSNEEKYIIKIESLNSKNKNRENFEKIYNIYNDEDSLYKDFIKTLTLSNPVNNLKKFINKNENNLNKIWKIVKDKEEYYEYPSLLRKSKTYFFKEMSPLAIILNSRCTTEVVYILINKGYPILDKEKGYLPFIIMNNFNVYHETSTDYLIDLSKEYKEYINIEDLITALFFKKFKDDLILLKMRDFLLDIVDFKFKKLNFNQVHIKILGGFYYKNIVNIVYIVELFDKILKNKNHNLDFKKLNLDNLLLLPYFIEREFQFDDYKKYSILVLDKINEPFIKDNSLTKLFKNEKEKILFQENEHENEKYEILKNDLILRKKSYFLDKCIKLFLIMLKEDIINKEKILLSNEILTNWYAKYHKEINFMNKIIKRYPIFKDNYAKFIEEEIHKQEPKLMIYDNLINKKRRI